MRVLFDTQILLWCLAQPDRVSRTVVDLLIDPVVERAFSVATIWEIAIKSAAQRPDFRFDAVVVRRQLLASGWFEFPILSKHAVAAARLPRFHKDPFDRLLVAQASVEDLTLVTADRMLARYDAPIRLV
jgi:PIN domain nuclease of toxin-antitoxin system